MFFRRYKYYLLNHTLYENLCSWSIHRITDSAANWMDKSLEEDLEILFITESSKMERTFKFWSSTWSTSPITSPSLDAMSAHLLNISEGLRLHHFPGQPLPRLAHPLYEKILSNIQLECSLAQLETISLPPHFRGFFPELLCCKLGQSFDLPGLMTLAFHWKMFGIHRCNAMTCRRKQGFREERGNIIVSLTLWNDS